MSEFYGPNESSKFLDSEKSVAMSEGDVKALAKKMEALDKLLKDQVRAKYKIEVQFGKGRSAGGPKHFPGAISLYLSGTKFHGGGDEKLYMCPTEGCIGVIDPKYRNGSQVLCPKCDRIHDENTLVGELLYRLTPQNWAFAILRLFERLEHNADIYLKYHPTDVRYQTMMEMARAQGGEQIAKARKNRGLHIYPLKNIIVDTKNGADLYKRILAFITA